MPTGTFARDADAGVWHTEPYTMLHPFPQMSQIITVYIEGSMLSFCMPEMLLVELSQ